MIEIIKDALKKLSLFFFPEEKIEEKEKELESLERKIEILKTEKIFEMIEEEEENENGRFQQSDE